MTTEPHYPTGWGGSLSLDQLLNDPQLRRAAFAKAGRLGLNVDDQADCVQCGCINLWQTLQTTPTLLADKGPVWAGTYVAYRGNPKQFHRHQARQHRFSDPAFDWETADESLRLGPKSDHASPHADWTTEIDEQIDVEAFIQTVSQYYADQPRKWIAFQAVAGLMTAREAAQQLGIHEKNFAASIGNQVRQEVQALLPETLKVTQPESWQDQLARGEGVDHITAIAHEVMHDQRLLLALYVVTTSASKKAVAETFGYGLTAFGKDIRKIKQMIATKYLQERIGQQ